MKKLLFSLAALALLLASCQTQEKDFVDEKATAPEIVATVETDSATRTLIDVDQLGEGTIYWTPADEINIFYGTLSTHYTSQNTANATTAVFRTTDVIGSTESASTNIWGLYPYDANATSTGSAISTTLPATQYGVPDTFDDDLYITLAHGTSTTLKFYNVCGGIKFSLSRGDITSITFKGNNNEPIAGDISLTFENGLPKTTVVNGLTEITLTPKTGTTFAQNTNYYIVALPGTLTGGFTMTFTTSGGAVGTFNYTVGSVTIKRSIFSKKAEIDTYATFDYSLLTNNVIYYTSTDGNAITPYATDVFGASIVSNEYNEGQGSIVFDGAVTCIGDNAFQSCQTLSSISIPESVVRIGSHAFWWCTELESLSLPDSVTIIDEGAFNNCHSLVSVNIPDGIEQISKAMFQSCTSLQSINLPLSVSSIGIQAFMYCSSLIEISIPEGVPSIEIEAFAYCSKLTSVSLPESLEFIGASAFNTCVSLSEIIIPDKCKSISSNAFYRCRGLQKVVIGNSVQRIYQSAFTDCSNISEIVFGEELTTIDDGAFGGCSSITSLSFKSKIERIEYRAFINCTSLKELVLGEGMSFFGQEAFLNCNALESVTVKAITPPTYGYRMFAFPETSTCSIYVPASSVDAYKTAWRSYASRIQAIPILPEAIVYLLASSNQGMKVDRIAREINEQGLFQRWDKEPVTERQIWAVVLSHPETFVKSDGRIRLMI